MPGCFHLSGDPDVPPRCVVVHSPSHHYHFQIPISQYTYRPGLRPFDGITEPCRRTLASCSALRRSNSSTLSTTTTGRPCFSTVTGSARAVSSSSPNAFFASFADIVFISSYRPRGRSVHNGYFSLAVQYSKQLIFRNFLRPVYFREYDRIPLAIDRRLLAVARLRQDGATQFAQCDHGRRGARRLAINRLCSRVKGGERSWPGSAPAR